jgi:hypothetical protein
MVVFAHFSTVCAMRGKKVLSFFAVHFFYHIFATDNF